MVLHLLASPQQTILIKASEICYNLPIHILINKISIVELLITGIIKALMLFYLENKVVMPIIK